MPHKYYNGTPTWPLPPFLDLDDHDIARACAVHAYHVGHNGEPCGDLEHVEAERLYRAALRRKGGDE